MGLGRNNWQNSKAMTLRAAVINLCLGAIMQPAAAQNNPVGNLIGGILNAAVIQAVQAEWEQLPLLHGSCLRTELQKRGMALSALIQRGIGPFHASLAAIADPCVRLQEEADANLARQRKEEADRAAELRRQEQARLDQEKKRETERIVALRKVTLRKNFRCEILDQALVFQSFCDENLYRKTDVTQSNPLQVLDAINARLYLEDLILDQVEMPDAKARRKSMITQFPNARSVPGTRYDCAKTKTPRESLVCQSYELNLVDGLYYDYFKKATALEKKGPAIAKEFSLSIALQKCENDSVCLKKTYVEGIQIFHGLLQDGKVTVPSYQEFMDQLRLLEEKRSAEITAQINSERQRMEAERVLREKKADEQRQLTEARQREADRAREAERLRLEEERLAKERAEQEQKRLAEERLRQEAEAQEQEKQKWLQASQKLSQDKPLAQIQLCKMGSFARKKLNEANDLAQRASMRQTLAQQCSCIVTALLRAQDDQIKSYEALLASFENGELQAEQNVLLTSTQSLCQSNLGKDILEGWKAN